MTLHPDPTTPGPKRDEDTNRETNSQTTHNQAAQGDPIEETLGGEDPYRLLFEKNPAGVAISTLDGRVLDCNDAWARILGYQSPDAIRGRMTREFYFDVTERPSISEELKQSGSFSKGEMQLRRKDGLPVWVLFNVTVFSAGDGRPLALATAIDVSEAKRTENRLRESELKFRTLYERSPIGIAMIDSRTAKILQVNPKFCEIAGRGEEELRNGTLKGITHPDDVELTREKVRQLANQEIAEFCVEKRYVRPDGEIRWVRISAVPMWGEGEQARWHVGLVEDITERKLADEALAAGEREQRQIAEQLEAERARLAEAQAVANVGSWEVDLGSLDVAWSEQTHRIFETDPLHFHPNRPDLFQFVHPDDRAAVKAIFEASLEKNTPSRTEHRVVMGDGRVKVIEEHWKVVRDAQNRPVRLAGTCQDVTERKRVEEALRASEEHFRLLVEQASDAIFLTDAKAEKFLDVNPAGAKMLGYTQDEMVRLCITDVIAPEDLQRVPAEVERFAGGSIVTSEWRMRRKDGTSSVGELVARQLPDGRLQGILRDITQRKAAERRLQEYERVLEGLDEMISVVNRDYCCVIANRAYLNFRGSEKQDVIGKLLSDVIDREIFANVVKPKLDQAFQGKVVEYEVKYTYPKIGERDVHVFCMPIDGPGGIDRVASILQDVTDRRRAEAELQKNVAQLQAVSEELRQAKEKLSEEKDYLEESIDSELGYGEIIGRSPALKDVMSKAATVAPSDATVLLLGETGTGKELLARALHHLSRRANSSFIKLNCAAIPSGLLESELFGHEKGAFTGADSRKVGKLELADGGTLFLDEIGEIPLNLQPKLLRVLQDQEFERLGGVQTLKVNFRLLAATNRDLLQSVKAREFRSDLYYRLNVFPIVIPPLRERRADIQPLVEHFVRKFALRMKKNITSIPKATMEVLVRWNWPGNIRELENFLERSVILTPGSVLQAPLSELEVPLGESRDTAATLQQKERDRILQALRECQGRLGGADGAAARLGLKRTTLQSKLIRLGIKPGREEN